MTPLHVGVAPAIPMISGFTARNMPHLPTRLHGRGHRNPKLRGWLEGCVPGPLPAPIKIPPYSLLTCRPKASQKTTNSFSHFRGLVPDTNYKHLECFVMLGKHSEPRRGRISHICDINALRVNYTTYNNVTHIIIICIDHAENNYIHVDRALNQQITSTSLKINSY